MGIPIRGHRLHVGQFGIQALELTKIIGFSLVRAVIDQRLLILIAFQHGGVRGGLGVENAARAQQALQTIVDLGSRVL